MADATSYLSPRMQKVLAQDGPHFGRPRPDAQELRGLQRLLAEGAPAARQWHLARAMSIVADNAPTPETAALLGAILQDGAAEVSLRRRAAALLGDMPGRTTSRLLVGALTAGPATLESTLLGALAKAGDEQAAQAIAARPRTVSAALQRRRDVARALILVRTGSMVDTSADRALMPIGRPLAIRQLAAEEAAVAIRGYRGSSFGVQLQAQQAWGFDCGGLRHLVLLSGDVPLGQLARALGERHRIVGVVAMQSERGATSYTTRRLIVARPGLDGIDISVLDSAGEVELVGSLKPQGDGHALLLRSHARSRNSVEVEGHLGPRGLELSARLFSGGSSVKATGQVDPAAS